MERPFPSPMSNHVLSPMVLKEVGHIMLRQPRTSLFLSIQEQEDASATIGDSFLIRTDEMVAGKIRILLKYGITRVNLPCRWTWDSVAHMVGEPSPHRFHYHRMLEPVEPSYEDVPPMPRCFLSQKLAAIVNEPLWEGPVEAKELRWFKKLEYDVFLRVQEQEKDAAVGDSFLVRVSQVDYQPGEEAPVRVHLDYGITRVNLPCKWTWDHVAYEEGETPPHTFGAMRW